MEYSCAKRGNKLIIFNYIAKKAQILLPVFTDKRIPFPKN